MFAYARTWYTSWGNAQNATYSTPCHLFNTLTYFLAMTFSGKYINVKFKKQDADHGKFITWPESLQLTICENGAYALLL